MEAAERRMREQEQRGIGNVNAVKRQQQQALEREKREQELANADRDAPLKVLKYYFLIQVITYLPFLYLSNR